MADEKSTLDRALDTLQGIHKRLDTIEARRGPVMYRATVAGLHGSECGADQSASADGRAISQCDPLTETLRQNAVASAHYPYARASRRVPIQPGVVSWQKVSYAAIAK